MIYKVLKIHLDDIGIELESLGVEIACEIGIDNKNVYFEENLPVYEYVTSNTLLTEIINYFNVKGLNENEDSLDGNNDELLQTAKNNY